MWFRERDRKTKILGEEEEVKGGRRLDITHPFIKQILIETFLYASTRLGSMNIAMNKANKNLPLHVLASNDANREGDILKGKLRLGQ